MQYRVIRNLGNSDYVVGSIFDGAALPPVRLRQLLAQRFIEPIAESPAGLSPEEQEAFAAWQEERGEVDTALADLTAENAQLKADLAAAQEALTAADDSSSSEGSEGDDGNPDAGEAEDLSEKNVEELRKLAAEREIVGRSAMNREQLIAALTAPAGQEGGSDE